MYSVLPLFPPKFLGSLFLSYVLPYVSGCCVLNINKINDWFENFESQYQRKVALDFILSKVIKSDI
jgi:hypothetical protein